MYRIYHLPFVSQVQVKATEKFLLDNDIQMPIPFGDLITYKKNLYYVGTIRGRRLVCEVALVSEPWDYPDLVMTLIARGDELTAYMRWRERAVA